MGFEPTTPGLKVTPWGLCAVSDLYGLRGRQAPVPRHYEVLVMVQSHSIRYRAQPGDEICHYPLSPCGPQARVMGNS